MTTGAPIFPESLEEQLLAVYSLVNEIQTVTASLRTSIENTLAAMKKEDPDV